jgi:hypothetical protein
LIFFFFDFGYWQFSNLKIYISYYIIMEKIGLIGHRTRLIS